MPPSRRTHAAITRRWEAELAEAVLQGGGTREKFSFDQSDLDALFAPD
jgi:hypothetical protein